MITKRPFLFFILVVGSLVTGALWYIQSSLFAATLKGIVARYLPTDFGIDADFTELSITYFPPGFSVRNPKISLNKRPFAGMSPGTQVEADSLDFAFRPLQIFSGTIRIHEVTVVNGRITLLLSQAAILKKPDKPAIPKEFHWDELLNVRAEAVVLKNTDFSLKFTDSKDGVSAHADRLRFAQWDGQGGLGYSLSVDLGGIDGSLLSGLGLPLPLDQIHAEANVNALGLQVPSISISDEGFNFVGSGNIDGNLFSDKPLKSEFKAKLTGDLKKLFELTRWISAKDLPEGVFEFSGKIQADPKKFLQTAKVEGNLLVRNAKYKAWDADRVQVDATWEADKNGGVVTARKVTIEGREIARTGGSQRGSGGAIEIGPVKWNIGDSALSSIPIQFHRAHIHWLVAIALKDVFPLDFRLNGGVTLNYSPASTSKAWELRADLGAWVEGFQLDNQRYLQTKPLRKVFQVPRIDLKGSVRVDPSGVSPNGLQVIMPNTNLKLSGKIESKKGYDLHASGNLDLADLKQIAENDIKGKGTLNAHIHGPSSRVLMDFDLDLKEAYYLRLFLGDLKGRIVWDDDPELLSFERVRITQGVTPFEVDGNLDLGPAKTVDLDVRVAQGAIKDFISVFKTLTQNLWWFPHQLNGPFSGLMKVSGGISTSDLKILAQLNGSNWEYAGERWKSVYLSGGYVKGKYLVDDFKALKNTGRMKGQISYGADGFIDWNFFTEDFNLSDLNLLSHLDVPMRGRLSIKTSGQGFSGAIASTTRFDFSDFTIRGASFASSQVNLQTKGGIAKLQGTLMGGRGVVDAVYDFHPREKSFVKAELKQFDFTPVLLVLNPRAVQDPALSGLISGGIDLNFRSGVVEKADGTIKISEYLLARSDSRFALANPVAFEIKDGSFDLRNFILRGRTGEIDFDLKGRSGQVEGTLIGEVDLSILQFFTPSVASATGVARTSISIGGYLKEPTFSGRASIDGGSIRMAALDSSFENVTSQMVFKQNILSLQKFEADLGGGRVSADGRVVLYPNQYPGLFVRGKILGAKLRVYPFQVAKVTGNLNIHGDEAPYQVDGQILVDSAVSREKVLTRRQTGQGLKAAQYAPVSTALTESSYSKFNLNIDVDAPRGITVQNDLFRDVELRCNLKIVNTLEAPRILGRADVLQGKLLFKDHVFNIQNASAKFDNPTVMNPVLDLSASTEVNHVKIQMFAGGRQDKLKVELTSNPAMQEAEILSLLAVGLTSNDAKKLNAADLSAVQQGEAASLVLHSLDFNRDLEDKTGFQVKLDESVNTQQGVSAFRPQGDAVAAPQITIRKKIGERLSLSAGSTVGVGSNKANQVNLDFSVTPDISITGVYNNYSVYGTADNQTIQNSGGFDLKFQKRFK